MSTCSCLYFNNNHSLLGVLPQGPQRVLLKQTYDFRSYSKDPIMSQETPTQEECQEQMAEDFGLKPESEDEDQEYWQHPDQDPFSSLPTADQVITFWPVLKIKECLVQAGLETSGIKSVLVGRLVQYYKQNPSKLPEQETFTLQYRKDEVNPPIQVVRLSQDATIPSRATPGSVGLDLSGVEELTIPPQGKALCKTDLRIVLPPGTYGRIAPRSGLAWRNHLVVGGGVIDPDFQGNVKVVLFNLGDEGIKIKKGQRIAQLICEKASFPQVKEVPDIKDPSERGARGFGSSGSGIKDEQGSG